MVENHVIPKLHNCKISVFDVSRITWCISGITWYSTMLFWKYNNERTCISGTTWCIFGVTRLTTMSFWNYITAKTGIFDVSRITWCISRITWYSTMLFWKYKNKRTCICGITWCISGITWLTTMSFRNYITAKSPFLMFPGLHGVFAELHGVQPCNSRNTKMKAHVYFRNHMVFFRNYMVDNHVIPKLHNCGFSVFDVSRITW